MVRRPALSALLVWFHQNKAKAQKLFAVLYEQKHRLAFYFGYNKKDNLPGPSGAPGIPRIMNGFQVDITKSLVYRGSWDYSVTARLHNRFFASVTDFHEPIDPLAWNGGWKAKGICIENVPNCDSNLPMIGTGEFGNWGGFKEGMIKLAPLNPAIPAAVKVEVGKIEGELKAGKFHPFTGPVKDQEGKERAAAGQVMSDEDLGKMNYFVEGVASKLPKS